MQKSGKSSIQDGKCFELELRIQRFTKCKYFSARWFNILIFRKMMAEEFDAAVIEVVLLLKEISVKTEEGRLMIGRQGLSSSGAVLKESAT